MRYQNWDVLVFPDQCNIPLQEFKTSCHVIQDPESHTSQTNPLLLPAVTSFIPGLSAGKPFRISVHCWENPDISRYLDALKKSSDNIVFEARLFIDGRIIGSKWFTQAGPWPSIIDLGIDLDKHGDFEKLKFPAFHSEILSQNYWNAGDDYGRIKVIIAEGLFRENSAYPFERYKNVVSFSFQHAPLDVLEASSIAWPNATMWRQVSLVGPYFAPQSPRNSTSTIELHGHTPRRTSDLTKSQGKTPALCISDPSNMMNSRQITHDPFTENLDAGLGRLTAFTGWRHASGDISMPDYSASTSISRASNSRQVTDPMSISDPERFATMAINEDCESLPEPFMPSAPVNTPQNGEVKPAMASEAELLSEKLATTPMKAKHTIEDSEAVPTSLLATSVASNIRGRKENTQESPIVPNISASIINEGTSRKCSLPAGNKRPRVLSSAASKVIDDEDEPRSSPSLRKLSRSGTLQDIRDGERRILSEKSNV